MKKRIFLGLSTLLVVVCFAPSVVALPVTVYSTDFETGADMSPWSDGALHGPDLGVTSFYHGNYTLGESTTLTLTGLADHTQLSLEFDLYLFWTWDGENTTYGPDYFSLSGDISGSWTFTNHQGAGQSYPGTPDAIYTNPPLGYPQGATDTHVYLGLDPTGSGDEFLINHTGDTFSVTFGGPTSQADEWWGIDNVRVSINEVTPIPEPSTFALLVLGTVGLVASRCRRRKAVR